MKIMMLSDSMGRGGSERRLTELLRGLSKIHDIKAELVVFSEKIQFDELYDLQIPIHIIKRNPKKDPRPFYKLFSIIKKSKPDIVHSWGSMSSIYALPSRWWQNIKLINAMIVNAPKMGLLDERLLRFKLTQSSSDIILANCKSGLDAYSAPRHKSQFVYNGYDFSRQNNISSIAEVRNAYQIQTPYLVGMVGAFAPRKDYGTFVELGNQVLVKRADVTFMAVGDGDSILRHMERVSPQVRDRFVFTGKVSDVESLLHAMDIGVLISDPAVHGEGISNAIMEYMAAGLPVIANDNGGNKEIIRDKHTGYLMMDRSIDRWQEKIYYLLDHPEEAIRLGENGKNRIRQNFGIERMIKHFVHIYKQVLKEEAPSLSVL